VFVILDRISQEIEIIARWAFDRGKPCMRQTIVLPEFGRGATRRGVMAARTALKGEPVKAVANVLGAAPTDPPTNRPGDLAKSDARALGAGVVIAKGCISAGDGG